MEITTCPQCNSEIDELAFGIIGQAMCPRCGTIVDLLTIPYQGDNDEDIQEK